MYIVTALFQIHYVYDIRKVLHLNYGHHPISRKEHYKKYVDLSYTRMDQTNPFQYKCSPFIMVQIYIADK